MSDDEETWELGESRPYMNYHGKNVAIVSSHEGEVGWFATLADAEIAACAREAMDVIGEAIYETTHASADCGRGTPRGYCPDECVRCRMELLYAKMVGYAP